MKREFRFRIYNKKEDKMYLSPEEICHLGSWFDAHLPGSLADTDNIEVMQSTGLKDKNGTTIYESDIIKWDDQSKGKYWRFAVVKFNPDIVFDCSEIKEWEGVENSSDYCFRFGAFIYNNTENHLEVIGNIHELNQTK